MGEVECSASSSETNPMLGISRQSKRESIGIIRWLSRPTLAWGGGEVQDALMVAFSFQTDTDMHSCWSTCHCYLLNRCIGEELSKVGDDTEGVTMRTEGTREKTCTFLKLLLFIPLPMQLCHTRSLLL